jgi:hypothetical protein
MKWVASIGGICEQEFDKECIDEAIQVIVNSVDIHVIDYWM